MLKPDRELRRDHDRVRPYRINKHESGLLPCGLDKVHRALLILFLRLGQCSISLEEHSLKNWDCHALVQTTNTAAMNRVSKFIRLISFSNHDHGKARARKP